MPGNDVDSDAKSVAHYQALITTWITVNLERDKTILTLATAAIGVLVTILTTVGVVNVRIIWLYVGAFAAFLLSGIAAFSLYRANTKILVHEIRANLKQIGDTEKAPDFGRRDRWAVGLFGVGVLFSIAIGVASALNMNGTGDIEMSEKKATEKIVTVEKIEKSLTGAEVLRPTSDQTESSDGGKQPASQDQSETQGDSTSNESE